MANMTAKQKLEALKEQQKAIRQELADEAASERAENAALRQKVFDRLGQIEPDAALADCLGVLSKQGVKTWGQLYSTLKTPGMRIKGSKPAKAKVAVDDATRDVVVAYVAANPATSAPQIAKFTGCVVGAPGSLAASGYLSATGKGRGCRYSVTASAA